MAHRLRSFAICRGNDLFAKGGKTNWSAISFDRLRLHRAQPAPGGFVARPGRASRKNAISPGHLRRHSRWRGALAITAAYIGFEIAGDHTWLYFGSKVGPGVV